MRLPLLHKTPALLPSELSQVTAHAVEELLREGQSENTLASYRAALRYWAAWFALRYGQRLELPLPMPAVLQFVVDHAQRAAPGGALRHELPEPIDEALVAGGFKGKPGPMALNTLVHRVAVLSKAHQRRKLKNPCADPKVRELLAMTRRAYAKRGELPKKKAALTREPLQAMLDTCDASLMGKRDRALLLFAFSSGGRRRSEVSSADLRFLAPGAGGSYIYTLAFSKTNQAGADRPENHKPIAGVAAHALRDWLAAAGITEGRIFRQVRKGGHLGAPLSPAAVREIVLRRAAAAGLPADFSAHSLRSGFATEATMRATPLAHTMALSGHRSVQSIIGYTRVVPSADGVSRLMDAPPAAGAEPGTSPASSVPPAST
jgi:integrase